jgi:hypothetical protein
MHRISGCWSTDRSLKLRVLSGKREMQVGGARKKQLCTGFEPIVVSPHKCIWITLHDEPKNRRILKRVATINLVHHPCKSFAGTNNMTYLPGPGTSHRELCRSSILSIILIRALHKGL